MRKTNLLIILLSVGAAAGAQSPPERQMNVTQGPERVFDEPVEQILPSLAGAKPTGENGRVGNELVFWGYELADGRDVFFFACALLPDVSCPDRVPLICTANSTVLETSEVGGNVTRRRCSDIAITAPGNPRPGCTQAEQSTPLMVGLVACG